MIWASGTMFGSSTPNASQDGTAGRNVNSELFYILFQHARYAGNQIFDTCIPRHFLLRFPCNCYLKCNIGFFIQLQIPLTSDRGPQTKLQTLFFCSILWLRHKDDHKSEQKKMQGSVTYSTDRENEFSKMFVLRNRVEQVIYHNSGFT